jgi:hypothetical protein
LVLSCVGGFGTAPQVGGFVADTSNAFAETLVLEGIAASIGSVGDAYDNALAETTIGLFQTCGVPRGERLLELEANRRHLDRVITASMTRWDAMVPSGFLTPCVCTPVHLVSA